LRRKELTVASKSLRFVEAVPYVAVIFFGAFTLLYDIFLLFGLSFAGLLRFMPYFSTAVALSAWIWYPGRYRRACGAVTADADSPPAKTAAPLPVMACAFGITLLWPISGFWTPTWLGGVCMLLFFWFREKRIPRTVDAQHLTLNRADFLWLCTAAALYAVLALVVKRPDADDATFTGIAVHLLSNPAEALFMSDPMFHGEKFAHRAQFFESFHALTAVLAYFFRISPAVAAHYVLAPAAAALFPLVWGIFFLRLGLPPRRIMPFLLVCGLAFAQTHASFGNFTYVRFFQGKALLANILIPYIYIQVHDICAKRLRGDAARMLLVGAAAFGCSFSSVFIVPQTLCIAALAHHPEYSLKKSARLLLPAISYGLALGLIFVFRQSQELKTALEIANEQDMPLLLSHVFGNVQSYLFLFFLLCAWTFLDEADARGKFLLATILWWGIPLNPLLPVVLNKVIAPAIVWREMWIIPFWGVVALGLSGFVEQTARVLAPRLRLGRTGAMRFVAGCFLLSMLPFANLRPSNIERLGVDAVWFPVRYAEILAAVEKYLEGKMTIMGPADVSEWLTTLPEDYSVYTYRAGLLAPDGTAADRNQAKRILGLLRPSLEDLDMLGKIVDRIRPEGVIARAENQEWFKAAGYTPCFQDSEGVLWLRVKNPRP
jgi:putative flippase GtrA